MNAIALGEGRAHKILNAWAKATTSKDVEKVIRSVAVREGEHALAFEKRMWELGYGLREREDPNFKKALKIAKSDISDRKKFEKLSLGGANSNGDGTDFLGGIFADKNIDIETGALFGRYISEERDSGRLLSGCYKALKADNKKQKKAKKKK
jgi:hypothetical protein